MNYQVFFIALAIGALVASFLSWRFSHRGIHPRFYPHKGLVVVVFIGLMGGAALVAFVISQMVGNPSPQIRSTTSVGATTAPAPEPIEKREATRGDTNTP